MKTYRIYVRHDNGEQGFHIRAGSIQQAKEMLMTMEKCPESAIIHWYVVPTLKQIKRTKSLMRGL